MGEPWDLASGPLGGQGGELGETVQNDWSLETEAWFPLPGWGEEAANEAERRPLPARRIRS